MRTPKNPARRFYFYCLAASLLLALVISFLLRTFLMPNVLELIEQSHSFDYVAYHDFDKDGISEQVTGLNDPKTHEYRLHVRNRSGNFLDQCNYSEPTRFDSREPWLVFGDYNDDDLDDIFTFSQQEDSLFLYMHDLWRKHVIIQRQFLFKAQSPGRDFWIREGGLINLNERGDKGLVFAILTGPGMQTRSVHVYDIQKRVIVNSLENHVFWHDLFFFDLTGDSREEVILTGYATGNIHHPQPYGDDRCWLFVLDQNLKPIFAPIPFGEYSSSLQAKPIEIDNIRYLLVAYHYQGKQNQSDFLCLVNSEGKLLPELYGNMHFDHLQVSGTASEPYIFMTREGNELIKMDKNFKTIIRKTTLSKNLWRTELIDIDRDGHDEIIYLFENQISIYDQKLQLRVKTPLPTQYKTGTYFTFRQTGTQNPVDVGINFDKDFYLYAYKKNWLYASLPFISVGLAPCIFGILVGGRRLSWLVHTYIHYLRASLQNSANGVALLDGHGVIYFHNAGWAKFLQFKNENGKHQHYAEALQKSPQTVSAIETCMNSGEPVRRQMALHEGNHEAECEIAVTPFISRLKLIRGYLVEIKESTDFAINGRLQSWSHAVQKIAHAIKSPLASTALNLTAFEMRLDELLNGKIDTAEQEQLDDDVKTMRAEIRRIEQLTKSFIHFTTLDKPHFQSVDIRQQIEQAIGSFKNFTTDKLQMQTNLDLEYHTIWADPQQIEKVLQILIENAVQALHGKGVIEISTAMAQYLDKPLTNYLEIEVADTGPGIAPEDHEKIFEPFYTTKKEEGTGMGLPIAKKIVEDHGGKIGVHSRPGFGAVLRFSVPLYEERT